MSTSFFFLVSVFSCVWGGEVVVERSVPKVTQTQRKLCCFWHAIQRDVSERCCSGSMKLRGIILHCHIAWLWWPTNQNYCRSARPWLPQQHSGGFPVGGSPSELGHSITHITQEFWGKNNKNLQTAINHSIHPADLGSIIHWCRKDKYMDSLWN